MLGQEHNQSEILYEYESQYSAIKQSFNISKADVLEKTKDVKLLILVVYFITLIIAIILASIFTRRVSGPISKIANQIGYQLEGMKIKNLFENINTNISDMLFRNSELNATLKNYTDSVSDIFTYKLLNGYPFSKEELSFLPTSCCEILAANRFCVAVLHFLNSADKENYVKDVVLLTNILLHNIKGRGVIRKVEYNKFALIFHSQEGDDKFYEESLKKILSILKKQGIGINCFIGDTYGVCDHIYKSYADAIHIMHNFSNIEPPQTIFYSDIKEEINSFEYSIDLEQKLIYMILNNSSNVSEMLDDIFITFPSTITKDMTNIINSLIFTIRRVMNKLTQLTEEEEKSIELLIMNIENSEKLEWIKKDFNKIVTILNVCSSKQSNTKDEKLIKDVNTYILDNFSGCELSVSDIATAVGTTESYLSLLYKQITGKNISAYIQQLRMEKTRDLLINTDLKVKEVAYKCGYYHINTFYKAFKRDHGISAKDFRDQERNKLKK